MTRFNLVVLNITKSNINLIMPPINSTSRYHLYVDGFNQLILSDLAG